ncbi:MAG: heme o synthase [Planctomycetota bacterium]
MSSGDAIPNDRSPVSVPVDAPGVLRELYELAKPRLTMLVVLTTAVGYFLAHPAGRILPLRSLLMTLVGTALVAASSSVLNQWIERDRDRRMPRTRRRPFATGRFDGSVATLYALIAGLGGLSILCVEANPLAAGVALVTLVLYVAVYTPLKTRHSLNTIVGAVPGALPPLIGWAAASGSLPPAAWSLFLIVFLWQIPHFLAIATMYREDYRLGGFRMLPVEDPSGIRTARTALLYTVLLVPVGLFPALLGLAGPIYATAAGLVGVYFLAMAIRFERDPSRPRARRLFFASLLHLPVILLFLCLDSREAIPSVLVPVLGGPPA